jgi:hypothetical protein
MPRPETVDDLVNWFRQTILTTTHGEVGIHVYVNDGQIAQTRKILNQTARPASGPQRTHAEGD